MVDGINTTAPRTVFLDANVTIAGETQEHTLRFALEDSGALAGFRTAGRRYSSRRHRARAREGQARFFLVTLLALVAACFFAAAAGRSRGTYSRVPRHLGVPQRQAYIFRSFRVTFSPSIDSL